MHSDTLSEVARLLSQSSRVLFVTGAGISADSGLPTYRGVGGIYDSGITEHGMTIEEALSGDTFQRYPELTWKHIMRIEAACRGARYNAAHEAIANLERHLPEVWVLTQNVDGFHHAAGSSKVIEIHGNIRHLTCTACRYRTRIDGYEGLDALPRCPHCESVIRPQVVLFGEELPMAAVLQMHAQISQGFDLVVMVGTTALFPYIAEPALAAKQRGIPTVEINPGGSELTPLMDYAITARAAEALPALWERVREAVT